MSAAVLREAAALMRSRAEASMPFVRAEGWWTPLGLKELFSDSPAAPIPGAAEDGAHIASWHPVVALAVADWLDGIEQRDTSGSDLDWPHPQDVEHALVVARAYVGGGSGE